MPRRHLSAEERAAWNQLARSVRPLSGQASLVDPEPTDQMEARCVRVAVKRPQSLTIPGKDEPRARRRLAPTDILDSSWEKRIAAGRLQPEMSVDLHGDTLVAAHQRLERTLAEAVARGVRIILIITGKLREKSHEQDWRGRGAIRAEIGHWLDRSAYAARIASVRHAHPRHGGAGAIYIILRRKK